MNKIQKIADLLSKLGFSEMETSIYMHLLERGSPLSIVDDGEGNTEASPLSTNFGGEGEWG